MIVSKYVEPLQACGFEALREVVFVLLILWDRRDLGASSTTSFLFIRVSRVDLSVGSERP